MKFPTLFALGLSMVFVIACGSEKASPDPALGNFSIPSPEPVTWEKVSTGLNTFSTCAPEEPCAFSANSQIFARSSGIAFTFAEAVSACASLVLLDQTEWRLPSLEELQKAVDSNLASILDADRLNVPQSWLWTSTVGPESAETAWVVQPVARASYHPLKTETFGVLCTQ